MSTTYSSQNGDTFEAIARRFYGDELQASRIEWANPGVVEPIPAGTALVVPAVPGAPTDALSAQPSNGIDEVALLVSGERFRFWSEIEIRLAIDTPSSMTFAAPFEPGNAAFRALFRPLSYRRCVVTVGGARLYTGTMLTPTPETSAESRTVVVEGYSLPGVLADCTPPASTINRLEFSGLTLDAICSSLLLPFGLDFVFEASPGATFERVAIQPDEAVLPFIIGLAQQRQLLVSSTEDGALLFRRAITDDVPVARLDESAYPVLQVSPQLDASTYYSSVTGIEGVSVGFDGSQYTVRNPRLTGVVRPYTFVVPDTQEADLQGTVEAKAGRMFAQAASYTVTVATWRDQFGELWAPNTLVVLTAPGAMVYNPYTFLIRSVTFSSREDQRTATLELVVPAAFNSTTPGAMPWDE